LQIGLRMEYDQMHFWDEIRVIYIRNIENIRFDLEMFQQAV